MRPNKPRAPGSAKDALTRMLAEIAATQGREASAGAEIAADFDGSISASMLRKSTDPDLPEDLGFRRVSRFTRHFRVRAAAEHLAACAGGIFVPLPEARGGRFGALAAAASGEFGEAMSELIRATSFDGAGGVSVTPEEAAHVVREWRDLVRTGAEVVAALEAIIAGTPAEPSSSREG